VAAMNKETRDRIRAIIEFAGGEYVGIRGDSVCFRDPVSDTTMTLYLSALSVENIKLSLKDSREKVLTVPPLQRTADVF
jgi:hypothetical protein